MIGGEKRPPSERPPSGRLAVDRRLLLILLLALLLRLVNVRFGLPDLLAADENFSVNFALPEGESIALTNYGPQLPQTAESIQREQARVSERMQASGKAGGRQKSSAKFRLLDEAARGRKRYNVYFLDRMWRPGLAEDLAREGVTWAIIDYGMMGRYLRVPGKYPDPVAFYHSVRKMGPPVKTFAPEVHSFGVLSVSSPGPLIEVYRLRPPQVGKAAGARQRSGEQVQP